MSGRCRHLPAVLDHRAYTFEEANAACARLLSGNATGKVVIGH